ncbi:uncharacterized protein MELLADRAFT_94516 [Melampsora larici-populina 98AG31]|uniref:Uncharacterized protein n=1 Tax=Melampsora larici-populina (strain 98AG31 / pathotype 3-4-7) TaxID=747676 RepID=F4RBP6_MELLP|nr:uncharacterized protein MELLADRAFT_94516 [Melampsora larici-populina 98AG31]EGG10138.1 hypothetical protein MELLADRAFT_94516 [Melampsora larici-populina 98AG31]
MMVEASDKAQLIWQNMILIAYASCIAAIPLGDALLFSSKIKHRLAIGVARSMFVSALGASLAMLLTFIGWLALEFFCPTLQIDHFIYRLIETRIKERAHSHLMAIFVLLEAVLLFLTILLGGFLGSITTFAGEQNQKQTRFSFASLFLDYPIGLSIMTFIQAIVWTATCIVSHFLGPKAPPPLDERQERMMFMMNQNASINNMKASRRVTFKTDSDASFTSCKRLSEASGASSTTPIIHEKGEVGSEAIRRISSATSSNSPLLPVYLRSTPPQNNQSSVIPPSYQQQSSNVNYGTPKGKSLAIPPPAIQKPSNEAARHKGPNFTVPPIVSSVTNRFSRNSFSSPKPRVPSSALSRYAWLKSHTGQNGPLNTSLPYSRVSGSTTLSTPPTRYQRDEHRKPESRSNRKSHMSRDESIEAVVIQNPHHLDETESYETDGTGEEWAETRSELSAR